MSKYLKSGPSRYLKLPRPDRADSEKSSVPGGTALVRNPSGYSDNDKYLFKQLNSATQFSINAKRAQPHQSPRYTTPYTTNDIELFDNLFAMKQNRDQAKSSTSKAGSAATAIKIMEFDDQSRSSNRASPVATKLSASIRYND